jgi:hypothetical protein
MFDGPWSGVPNTIRCGEESLLSQIIVDPSDRDVFLGDIGFWLALFVAPGFIVIVELLSWILDTTPL